MLLIIGRLVHPGSERHLFPWAQHISGLNELIDSDFSQLSLNSLYKVMGVLFEHKTAIESHLRATEHTLFSLKETIILYDLTNTYFEICCCVLFLTEKTSQRSAYFYHDVGLSFITQHSHPFETARLSSKLVNDSPSPGHALPGDQSHSDKEKEHSFYSQMFTARIVSSNNL